MAASFCRLSGELAYNLLLVCAEGTHQSVGSVRCRGAERSGDRARVIRGAVAVAMELTAPFSGVGFTIIGS